MRFSFAYSEKTGHDQFLNSALLFSEGGPSQLEKQVPVIDTFGIVWWVLFICIWYSIYSFKINIDNPTARKPEIQGPYNATYVLSIVNVA